MREAPAPPILGGRDAEEPDSDSELDQVHNQLANAAAQDDAALPNRLLTAFEVAELVGCHVRRAYLRGLLVSQRFGVRSRRFHPRDVLDWIRRGAPTRPS